MSSLSICIPNYNRPDSLDDCLNSIRIAKDNFSKLVFEVCISDNSSENGPLEIIKKYEKDFKIKFHKNDKNLGFALNAIQTVKMASCKFAWLIGNDDLILPNTFRDLYEIFDKNKDSEFFFVNSYYLNSEYLEKYSKPFDTHNLNLEKMDSICKKKINKKVNFWEIIDPKVSWEFLTGIFLCIFMRDKWLQGLKFINEDDIKDVRVWSNFDNTCINAKIVSSMFKDSCCYISSKPASVNIIGKREWIDLYDFVEIVRIPELIDYYRKQGLGFFRYIYCKNFALRNFFNFFAKIFIFGKKSGRQYVNVRKHFFYNLVYPNAWLSIIYFLFRFIRKVLRV